MEITKKVEVIDLEKIHELLKPHFWVSNIGIDQQFTLRLTETNLNNIVKLNGKSSIKVIVGRNIYSNRPFSEELVIHDIQFETEQRFNHLVNALKDLLISIQKESEENHLQGIEPYYGDN